MKSQEPYPGSPELRRISARGQFSLALLLLCIFALTFVDVRAGGGTAALVTIAASAGAVIVSRVVLFVLNRGIARRWAPTGSHQMDSAAEWDETSLIARVLNRDFVPR